MPTALITGASQGIGEAFAMQLADRGHDVVLVARNEDALIRVAEQVKAHERQAEVLVADLTDRADLRRVEERLADAARPVELLINNAGFGTTGIFHEMPLDEEDREVMLNVLALMRLSHVALTGMAKRGTAGGHRGIINISSIAGFQPAPGTATYSGTKAFVTTFSLSLHEEYRTKGITVLAVAPGATRTEWQARAGYDASHWPDFVWQTADEVAAGSLRAFDAKRALYTSGPINKIVAGATHLAPRALLARVAGMFSGQV